MKSKLAIAILFIFFALPARAQYSSPQGITTDPWGNLWLAEASANAVVEISPANGAILKQITAGLDNPVRLAFDSNAKLYVANLVSNDVTVYSSAGTLTRTIPGINRPLGVAVNGAGDLFVASNSGNEVFVFNAAGSQIALLNTDTSGHFFDAPGALAVYGPNLYVAFNDGSVISYNSSNFASGSAIEVTKYVHSGSGGPTGIAFDSMGDVYVSYYYTNDVVEYSPSGTVIMDITSDVSQPEGIAVDSTGRIYAANTGSLNTVSVFNGSSFVGKIQGGRVVNFDQDTTGKAIASGTVVNQTYASWGVTFETEGSGGNAFAVACPNAASQPNAIGTSSTSCNINMENLQSGAIQANFSPQVTTVSIQVAEFCYTIGKLDAACLPPISGTAFLAAYNSSGTQIAHIYATAFGVQQTLTVTAPAGQTIAFVQFSVPWVSGKATVVGNFDNLTFE
jgi:sugar lactone lactonase YvrE